MLVPPLLVPLELLPVPEEGAPLSEGLETKGKVVVGVVVTFPVDPEEDPESGGVVLGGTVPEVPPVPGWTIVPPSLEPVPVFPPGINPPSELPLVKRENEAKLEF